MSHEKALQLVQPILDRIAAGELPPWRKKWHATGSWPKNLATGNEYNGFNSLILAFNAYASPYWLTYKQTQALGGSVKPGSKGTRCMKFGRYMRENSDGETVTGAYLNTFVVFNLEQCDGLVAPIDASPKFDNNPIAACERVVASMPSKPELKHGFNAAFYTPVTDIVSMPDLAVFETSEDYYATLFHELGHATGHHSRLDRKSLTATTRFGDEQYSREELTAELCAAMVCATTGIQNDRMIGDCAAYCANWAQRIRRDPNMFLSAANAAGKAADFILSRTRPEYSDNN